MPVQSYADNDLEFGGMLGERGEAGTGKVLRNLPEPDTEPARTSSLLPPPLGGGQVARPHPRLEHTPRRTAAHHLRIGQLAGSEP